MVELDGARVLVVGAGGIGGRIAARLVDRGARVVVASRGRKDVEGAVGTVELDVRHPASIISGVDAAVALLGGLDGVVNAAGVVAFGPIWELSDATLDELIAVDLVGPLRLMRAAAERMESGFIVNLTGVVAEQPVAGMAAYSAAKAGLAAASVAVGREFRRRGIHVLDASPPHTETGLAGRPVAGEAPRLPPGLDPDAVADTIVAGLERQVARLAPSDFA